jgi:hypothetical protein
MEIKMQIRYYKRIINIEKYTTEYGCVIYINYDKGTILKITGYKTILSWGLN